MASASKSNGKKSMQTPVRVDRFDAPHWEGFNRVMRSRMRLTYADGATAETWVDEVPAHWLGGMTLAEVRAIVGNEARFAPEGDDDADGL